MNEQFQAYICPVDAFIYEESEGVPELGIAPGTRWHDLPTDWCCPFCGEHRSTFVREAIPYANNAGNGIAST